MMRCIIVGAAKCGSTALTAMLDDHPDVFMVDHEVHYFAYDEYHARGPAWYEDMFAQANGVRVQGENSNTYTMSALWPQAPERFAVHYEGADVRAIYLVRHPLERMESMWIEKRSHGGDVVHHDFDTAVRTNTDWLLDPSRYAAQIRPYRRLLGDDRILVVESRELRQDPQGQLARCWAFLGLDPHVPAQDTELNASTTKTVETSSLSRIRATPLVGRAARLAPRALKRRVKRRYFRQPVAQRPTWDPVTRRWAGEVLAEDAAELLDFAGFDRATWFGDDGRLWA